MKKPIENIQYDEYFENQFVRILKKAKHHVLHLFLDDHPVAKISLYTDSSDDLIVPERQILIPKRAQSIIDSLDLPLLINTVIRNRQRYLFIFEVDNKQVLLQPFEKPNFEATQIISVENLSEKYLNEVAQNQSVFLLMSPEKETSLAFVIPPLEFAAFKIDSEISLSNFLANPLIYAEKARAGEWVAINESDEVIAILMPATESAQQ